MPDRHLIPLFIFGTLLIVGFAVAIVIAVIIQKQRQAKAKLARQRLEFEYSQSLLDTRIEVQEATLTAVARELHDNVAQALTGCFMQVEALKKHMAPPAGVDPVGEATANIERVISGVRLLSHNLSTGMVERRDLHDAIQTELSRIERFSNIHCNLRSTTIHELNAEQKLIAFRIVQEVLQNVLKHAKATSIAVSLDSSDTHFQIRLRDDGVGFDVAHHQPASSMGLINMNERVGLLKGELTIRSEKGGGTEVDIIIPIKA